MSEYDLVLGKATPSTGEKGDLFQISNTKIADKLAGIEREIQELPKKIMAQRYEAYREALREGKLTPNDVRKLEGFEPIEDSNEHCTSSGAELINFTTPDGQQLYYVETGDGAEAYNLFTLTDPVTTRSSNSDMSEEQKEELREQYRVKYRPTVESGIDAEKKAWFAEIGMTKLDKPYSYYCVINGKFTHYSEEYLRNTPLSELKEKDSQNRKCFEKVAKNDMDYAERTAQDISRILRRFIVDNTEFSKGANAETENERVAVLEYKVDEMQGQMKAIKNGLDTLEKMLKEIANNPFGLKS